jgi:hypothetical protein
MSYRTTQVLSMTDIDDNMRIIDEDYENLTKEFQEEKNYIKRMIYDIKEETRNPEKKNYQKNKWCEGAAMNKTIDDTCSEYTQSLLTINSRILALHKDIEQSIDDATGGRRRIKKRTRRHKKKRGKKTRGKRTRANRSKH